VTVSPRVRVICSDCGALFEISRSSELEHARRNLRHVCRDCRYPPRRLTAREMVALKSWWLSRYSLAELRSWPPLP
jgi:hypothetical protein